MFGYTPDPDTGYCDDLADFEAQKHEDAEDAAAREAATPNPYRQMAIDMAMAHAAVLTLKEIA